MADPAALPTYVVHLTTDQLMRMIKQAAIGATDEVLDTRGAAALLLVSESTALKWAAAGIIPARKLDGRWRFRRSALLDYLSDPARLDV